MITETYLAPSSWACLLINGDDSGMDEADSKACMDWLKSTGHDWPVSCEDAGFHTYHDARRFCPFAADCQTYTFLSDKGAHHDAH